MSTPLKAAKTHQEAAKLWNAVWDRIDAEHGRGSDFYMTMTNKRRGVEFLEVSNAIAHLKREMIDRFVQKFGYQIRTPAIARKLTNKAAKRDPVFGLAYREYEQRLAEQRERFVKITNALLREYTIEQNKRRKL